MKKILIIALALCFTAGNALKAQDKIENSNISFSWKSGKIKKSEFIKLLKKSWQLKTNEKGLDVLTYNLCLVPISKDRSVISDKVSGSNLDNYITQALANSSPGDMIFITDVHVQKGNEPSYVLDEGPQLEIEQD